MKLKTSSLAGGQPAPCAAVGRYQAIDFDEPHRNSEIALIANRPGAGAHRSCVLGGGSQPPPEDDHPPAHDKVPPPGIPRGFPPIAPLINCPFHSKNILDEAIRRGAGSAGSAIFA